MGIQQSCKQAKGARPTRGEWKDEPINILAFFCEKMTRFQVKYIKEITTNRTRNYVQ